MTSFGDWWRWRRRRRSSRQLTREDNNWCLVEATNDLCDDLMNELHANLSIGMIWRLWCFTILYDFYYVVRKSRRVCVLRWWRRRRRSRTKYWTRVWSTNKRRCYLLRMLFVAVIRSCCARNKLSLTPMPLDFRLTVNRECQCLYILSDLLPW